MGRAGARFLQSGHSHEDVDGFVGHVAGMLEENNELHLPGDFRRKLQAFLDQPQARVCGEQDVGFLDFVCNAVGYVEHSWILKTIISRA